VERIGGESVGDIYRQAADQLARPFQGNSPLDRLFYTAIKAVGYIEGAVADTFFPVSDPGYLVTRLDGSQVYHMGEGPSTAALANQAFLAAPFAASASRPTAIAAPSSAAVDKSWKTIIQGTPQPSKTPGHTFRTYREAIEMAKSGQYEEVYINRAYSKVTGTTTTPRRRPDVLGKRHTGQFDAVEVPSMTDNINVLRDRNIDAMNQLPANQRGNVIIAPIR
jgi:hypothetical protein